VIKSMQLTYIGICLRSDLKSVAANHTAVCSWASSLFKNRCDQWLL